MSDINDNDNWYSSFLTLKIQVLYSIFLRLAFKNVYVHDLSLFSRLKFYQHCEFFGISQLSKTLMSFPSFRFTAFVTCFATSFFNRCLCLNWAIDIISKNSMALLIINIAEAIRLGRQTLKTNRGVGLKTASETYIRHRNSDCCRNTLFYTQLGSARIPQSCLFFQDFRGSKLLNGCLIVWPSNLCLLGIQ